MYIRISCDKLKEIYKIVKVEKGESAMYTMENQYLKVKVCEKGAELQSIFDKEMGKRNSLDSRCKILGLAVLLSYFQM